MYEEDREENREKEYEFLVTERKICEVKVMAEDKQEAMQKLEDLYYAGKLDNEFDYPEAEYKLMSVDYGD